MARAELQARAVGSSIDLTVPRDVRLGRRIKVEIAPGTRNELRIGTATNLGDDIVLHFLGGKIEFGSGVIVRKGVWADTSGTLTVGDGVFIGTGSFLHCAQSTTIEALAVLAERVVVTDSRHLRTPADVPALDHIKAAPTRVGRNCWLGAHAVVTAGVSVGAGAFVGANAVVTSDVLPNWLAVGSPARAVRPIGLDHVDIGPAGDL
ncbi:MAG: acyltransferase [Acidimicrobiales bacterium]